MFKRAQARGKSRYQAALKRRRPAPAAAAAAAAAPMAVMRTYDRAEFKSYETTLTGGYFSSTPAFATLNCPAPGTGLNQRIGRQITLRSIELRLGQQVLGTANTGSWVRAVVFYDRQTNAATPAVTDLLMAADVWSPRNLDNRHRFSILHDDLKYCAYQPDGQAGHVMYFYRKLRHPTTFNAVGGGTVADITSGGLFLLLLGNMPLAGGDESYAFGYTRLRYTDD